MPEDSRQEEEKYTSEARYLLAAALFVGAPVPYLFAMAVLGGSLWDGFDVFWRWSLFFFLVLGPAGSLSVSQAAPDRMETLGGVPGFRAAICRLPMGDLPHGGRLVSTVSRWDLADLSLCDTNLLSLRGVSVLHLPIEAVAGQGHGLAGVHRISCWHLGSICHMEPE
jgi:hypothetical protein